MAIQTKTYLKQQFESGDRPRMEDYHDLIDSTYNVSGGDSLPVQSEATSGLFLQSDGTSALWATVEAGGNDSRIPTIENAGRILVTDNTSAGVEFKGHNYDGGKIFYDKVAGIWRFDDPVPRTRVFTFSPETPIFEFEDAHESVINYVFIPDENPAYEIKIRSSYLYYFDFNSMIYNNSATYSVPVRMFNADTINDKSEIILPPQSYIQFVVNSGGNVYVHNSNIPELIFGSSHNNKEVNVDIEPYYCQRSDINYYMWLRNQPNFNIIIDDNLFEIGDTLTFENGDFRTYTFEISGNNFRHINGVVVSPVASATLDITTEAAQTRPIILRKTSYTSWVIDWKPAPVVSKITHTADVSQYGLGIIPQQVFATYNDFATATLNVSQWYEVTANENEVGELGWYWLNVDNESFWFSSNFNPILITDPPYLVGTNGEDVCVIEGFITVPNWFLISGSTGFTYAAYGMAEPENNDKYIVGDTVNIVMGGSVYDPVWMGSTYFKSGDYARQNSGEYFPYYLSNYDGVRIYNAQSITLSKVDINNWTLTHPDLFLGSNTDYSGWGNDIQLNDNGVLQRYSLSQNEYQWLTDTQTNGISATVDHTTLEWNTVPKPILPNGVWGRNTDSGEVMMGDGVSSWDLLEHPPVIYPEKRVAQADLEPDGRYLLKSGDDGKVIYFYSQCWNNPDFRVDMESYYSSGNHAAEHEYALSYRFSTGYSEKLLRVVSNAYGIYSVNGTINPMNTYEWISDAPKVNEYKFTWSPDGWRISYVDELPYHSHQAGLDVVPTIQEVGGNTIDVGQGAAWFYIGNDKDELKFWSLPAVTGLSIVAGQPNYLCAYWTGNDANPAEWRITNIYGDIDYVRYVPYKVFYRREGSSHMHTQNIELLAHGEVELHHQRIFSCARYDREASALTSMSVTGGLNNCDIQLNGGGIWTINHRYEIPDLSANTEHYICSNANGKYYYYDYNQPNLNTAYTQGNDTYGEGLTQDTGPNGSGGPVSAIDSITNEWVYQILDIGGGDVGTTDWTSFGASANEIGLVFQANTSGAITGTGLVYSFQRLTYPDRWYVAYIYRGIEDEDHVYQFNDPEWYASKELAQASKTLPQVPGLVESHAMMVGRIIYAGQSVPESGNVICESAFDTVFVASSNLTDHSTLSNRDDVNAHVQYALIDNTQLTGQTNVVTLYAESIVFDGEYVDGIDAGNVTIDWSLGNKHYLNWDTAVSATFINPLGPTNLTLRLQKINTNSNDITFITPIKWSGGVVPTWTKIDGAIDILNLYFDGTNYYGSALLDMM